MLVWQFLIVSKRHRRTAGDEKGDVWLYSTESNLTQDTSYSISTTSSITIQLLLPHIVFIFNDLVWCVQIYLHHQRKVLDLTLHVCYKPTPVDPTKPRQQNKNMNNENLGLTLFLLEHNKNKSFHYFNYSSSSTSLSKHTLSF